VSHRGLRRGQVNFRSHNSCLSLGAPSPGRRRACVLFGIFFRGGYSPTGLPGDTVWLALPPTGWGWLSVLSHCVPPSRPAGHLGPSRDHCGFAGGGWRARGSPQAVRIAAGEASPGVRVGGDAPGTDGHEPPAATSFPQAGDWTSAAGCCYIPASRRRQIASSRRRRVTRRRYLRRRAPH